MSFQSPYVYVVTFKGQPPAIFTWPNVARKYIRDIFSKDGELHLPPGDYITLERYKVNPKPAQAVIIDRMNVEVFLAS